MLVRNMALVLQKSKQVKTRVDIKGKIVGSKNGIVSLSGTLTISKSSIFLFQFFMDFFERK